MGGVNADLQVVVPAQPRHESNVVGIAPVAWPWVGRRVHRIPWWRARRSDGLRELVEHYEPAPRWIMGQHDDDVADGLRQLPAAILMQLGLPSSALRVGSPSLLRRWNLEPEALAYGADGLDG